MVTETCSIKCMDTLQCPKNNSRRTIMFKLVLENYFSKRLQTTEEHRSKKER